MQISELIMLLSQMASSMDTSIDQVNSAATKAQERVFALLLSEVDKFDTTGEAFTTGQPLAQRFAYIQQQIEIIIANLYNPALQKYLNKYPQIENEVITLHKEYNNITVGKSNFEGARQSIYKQAEYYLLNGLADAYIQPAKYLLMQAVANGSTIKQARSILTNWDKGQLPTGKLASDRHVPRLQAYATQIARDTIYTYQGTIQDVIKEKYGLTKIIYVGGLVSDSRPACRYLVGLNRKIALTEIPQILLTYPQGIKPNTTMDNFIEVRCGYNCTHIAMPVK